MELTGVDSTFLTGIGKLQGKLIRLRDIDKVIVEEEELEKILHAKDALCGGMIECRSS